jgi:hypothetical protein
MHFLGLDGGLWTASVLGEALLLYVLWKKRLLRTFPLFSAYLTLNLVEDPIGWILHSGSPSTYFRFYFAVTLLDYALQLLVLLEIAFNVLSPVRRSLPSRTVSVLLGGLLVSVLLAAWLAPHETAARMAQVGIVFLRLTVGLAVLRLLVFVVVAGFSQMLGIGWRNHVLQLTTGLAFYGAISLFIQLAISRLNNTGGSAYENDFHGLIQLQSAAYVGTLLFWIWAFSRNDAPRREFTPQMREVLVTIAGTARRTRLTVTRGIEGK